MKLTEIYNGIITENIETEFEDAFEDALQVAKQELPKQETPAQEAIGTTAAGLALSTPFLIKMLGKLWIGLENVVNKLKKQDSNPESLGQRIVSFADKMHHKVMIPFEFIAKRATKDPKKQKLIAELIFLSTIGALLMHTGVEVGAKLAAKKFSPQLALKTAKGTVKGAEITKGVKNVKNIVKGIQQQAQEIL